MARPEDSFESVKQMMLDYRMEFCPVISSDHKVIDIYYWEDIFLEQKPWIAKKFNLPVVIMAGGKGSRLRPQWALPEASVCSKILLDKRSLLQTVIL